MLCVCDLRDRWLSEISPQTAPGTDTCARRSGGRRRTLYSTNRREVFILLLIGVAETARGRTCFPDITHRYGNRYFSASGLGNIRQSQNCNHGNTQVRRRITWKMWTESYRSSKCLNVSFKQALVDLNLLLVNSVK